MSIQQQLSQTSGLLSAVDAVRNWRAAALMLGGLVAAGLLGSLAGVVSFQVHPALGAVFALLAVAVFFYGVNAAGVMLMDEAQGSESRPVLSAVLTALSIGHRLILLMLLVGLVYVVGLLVMALLLLLCKIPGLGSLLFAFVFPVCVVVSGIAIFAGYAVIAPLAGPAVWSGATTMQALSRLGAIARQRIVVVVLSVLVLLLICGLVGSLIVGVIFTGTLITGGMSAGIIGVSGMDLGSVMSLGGMSGYGSSRDGASGHVAAGAFGWGLVMAVAFTLPLLVYLRGCCQLYLANLQGVDTEGFEQQLRDKFDAAKRSASEIKAKGEAMAAQQAQRFEKPAEYSPAPEPEPSSSQAKCAVCSTPYLPGDVFCGGCGSKLTP